MKSLSLATSTGDPVYHLVPKHLAHVALCGQRVPDPLGDAVVYEDGAPMNRRPCEWCLDAHRDLAAYLASLEVTA